jgi:hypothetical protein
VQGFPSMKKTDVIRNTPNFNAGESIIHEDIDDELVVGTTHTFLFFYNFLFSKGKQSAIFFSFLLQFFFSSKGKQSDIFFFFSFLLQFFFSVKESKVTFSFFLQFFFLAKENKVPFMVDENL